MPLYRFTVHHSNCSEDPVGTELRDDAAACLEAELILQDLNKSHQTGRMYWAVDVTEGERKVATINWPPDT
jgi:hypothetical protein